MSKRIVHKLIRSQGVACVVEFHGRFINGTLNFLFLRATLLAWDDILELICCDLALPAASELQRPTSRRLRSVFHVTIWKRDGFGRFEG
jgi:hypothetical protein